MVTEVFVLCDAANDSNGKLNILGAFDTLAAAEYPLVHPHCAIAVRLRHGSSESAETRVSISIQSADAAHPVANIETILKPGIAPTPTATANLIVNINSLRFETPGDYNVTLHVNGIPTAITPLYARVSQAPLLH